MAGFWRVLMNNKEIYDETIISCFELESDVTNVTRGVTQNWDSLGHMILIDKLECAFDILLEPDDILNLTSYFSGIEILKKYGIEI